MYAEVNSRDSIFNLSSSRWFVPGRDMDFSVSYFGAKASTPLGPAAGPHTQLAQNIVLSWLAGARIIELKTVQEKDNLELPRPCIHIPNIGYNVEWSQELSLDQSLKEYAKAVYLIEILKESRVFGRFPKNELLDTLFEVSIGYDLKGIKSEKMTRFLENIRDPKNIFDSLRKELPKDFSGFRHIKLPDLISESVTLSTFHGCPPFEVEKIARYLLERFGVNVVLKMNPTLLGFEEVRRILHDRLAYTHIKLMQEAFKEDLKYNDALELVRELHSAAKNHDAGIGVKFTNTLVAKNDPRIFPTQGDPAMYLSGSPLHVIAMTLMTRFRDDLGLDTPFSFSGGVDTENVADTVACGLTPVTICTDLLKQGGYGRFSRYLKALEKRMKQAGVRDVDGFILASESKGKEAIKRTFCKTERGSEIWKEKKFDFEKMLTKSPTSAPELLSGTGENAGMDGKELLQSARHIAGKLNSEKLIPFLEHDPAYHFSLNRSVPKKTGSELKGYDCLNCNLCVEGCPNGAPFVYIAKPVISPTSLLANDGKGELVGKCGQGFKIEKTRQVGIFADACNECASCSVYCPDSGAPFAVKERFYASRGAFEKDSPKDGFCKNGATLFARIQGYLFKLEVDDKNNRGSIKWDGSEVVVNWKTLSVISARFSEGRRVLDTAILYRLKVAWRGVFAGSIPNMLNVDSFGNRVVEK